MEWPFGKYKGWDTKNIPIDYLKWIVNGSGIKIYGALKNEVENILNSGIAPGMKMTFDRGTLTFGKKTLDEHENPDILDTHAVVSAVEHAKLKAKLEKIKKELTVEKAYVKKYKNAYLRQLMQLDRLTQFNSELQFRISLMSRSASYRPGNGQGDAKRVFRELAFKWHPDRGGTKEAMQAVNEFFSMLDSKS